MARRPVDRDLPSALDPFLLPGERVVVVAHHHWARVAEPFGTALLGLVVALWVDSNITASTQFIATVVWFGFFALVVRAVWNLLEWRHDWFVATDKRLLLRYGLVTHKVAMMPLLKVTDMSYVRPIPGQLLGYGRFIMESAGQEQAMRVVDWVPHPDETYRAICAEIFRFNPPGSLGGTPPPSGAGGDSGPEGPDDEGDGDEFDDWDDALPGDDPQFPDVPPIDEAIQHKYGSWSRAVPIHGGEQVYLSDDVRESRRGPDTGPIVQHPGWRRRWRGQARDNRGRDNRGDDNRHGGGA